MQPGAAGGGGAGQPLQSPDGAHARQSPPPDDSAPWLPPEAAATRSAGSTQRGRLAGAGAPPEGRPRGARRPSVQIALEGAGTLPAPGDG